MASSSRPLKRHAKSSYTDLLASDDFEAALLSHSPGPSHSTPPSSDDDEPELRSRREQAEANEDIYGVTGFGEGGKYMRNKRKKLKIQNAELKGAAEEGGEELPQIFHGLRVYINGFTEELGLRQVQELFIKRGGDYVPYLDKKGLITHIIATVLTPSKRLEFKDYKVAHPNWLIESAKQGKLLNWWKFPLLEDAGESTSGFGTEDGEANPLGNQTGQRTLFTMAAKSPPTKTQADVKGKGKQQSETLESLGARGVRLAQDALAQEKEAAKTARHSFFDSRQQSKPVASTSTSKPKDSPRKPPPPTTDSMTENWSPYLPRTARSDRTNALLADPVWLLKNTSAGPNFISTFFENSRLHHLSTWKQELKTHVANLQPDTIIPLRKHKLTGGPSDGRTIAHVDFDCFFVSAGLTLRPHLRGKPVAVCHGGDGEGLASTSEIASCSYEARAKGVANGTSLGRARERCPEIQTMPFDFDLYKNIASKFYQILLGRSDFLQAVSIDEVLIDITNQIAKLPPSDEPAIDFAKQLQRDIFDATGCPASIGLSHNILLARLATRKAKPAGVFHLLPDDIPEFLAPLSVDSLPGLGYMKERKLEKELEMKDVTVGDLLNFDQRRIQSALGKTEGKKFALYAKGIDTRELDGPSARGSVSVEVNYGIRFTEIGQVKRFMLSLGQEVSKRLKKEGVQAKHATLKIMIRRPDAPVETPKFLGHGVCNTFNQAWPVPGKATDDATIIGEGVWSVLKEILNARHINIVDLRGIGVMMTKLEKDGVALDLVRERGQPMLSFGPVIKTTVAPRPAVATSSTSRPSPPPAEVITLPSSSPATSSPAQNTRSNNCKVKKEPSIVIIDSDDDIILPPAKPATVTKPSTKPSTKPIPKSNAPKVAKASKPIKEVIPSIFSREKKVEKVSDADLHQLGIDSTYYKALPEAYKASTLAAARSNQDVKPVTKKAKKVKEEPKKAQSLLTSQSQSSKASLQAASTSKKGGATSSATPAALLEISSDEIRAMGHDEITFRELSPAIQGELHQQYLDQRRALTVPGRAASVPVKSGPRPYNVLSVKIFSAPVIRSAATLDEISTFLEEWVADAEEEGPEEGEVGDLVDFLGKVMSKKKGQDLAKGIDTLRWFEYVVEDTFGEEKADESIGARRWREALRQVRAAVEGKVQEEVGARLLA